MRRVTYLVAVLAFFPLPAIAQEPLEPPYELVLQWGSEGTGDGQFGDFCWDVAVDVSGNVYVTELHANRIQKFDSDGNFLTKWGSQGSGDGQFDELWGVAVDGSGNVYVTDTGNRRVQKFDSNGNFLAKWGSPGTGNGEFGWPRSIAVDAAGYVYVADTGNARIQKFDSNGNFVAKWGSAGSGDGQFQHYPGVAVGGSGDVFVADQGNHRIQKFDSDGTFLAKWGSEGSGAGQFLRPVDVAVDAAGNVYVVDIRADQIQKFTGEGTLRTKWDVDLHSLIQSGIAVDASGSVYVSDGGNHRILKFAGDSDGDGLRDDWEIYGYTHANGEFVDLPAMGADPEHKDVFVQIDYMVGLQPMSSALQKVVAAFANAPVDNPDGSTGITLHVDLDEELGFVEELGTLQEGNYVWIRPDGSDVTHFDDLKADHFPEELGAAVHYCIWANKIPGGASGMSRGIEAGDFIVSLGDWIEVAGQSEESWEAGTLMHELGHNLGLRHGGGDDVNFKPNYLSVMNWSFQMDGLMYGGELEHLDFSRSQLDALKESGLDESKGLTPAADVSGYGTTWWWTMYVTDWEQVQQWTTDAASAIDWRVANDPNPGGTAGGDVNTPPQHSAVYPETLSGYDDWSSLVFTGGTVGGGVPAPPPPATPVEELDLDTALKLLTPAPVTKLNGHVADGNKLHLTWKPAGPQKKIKEYRIYRDNAQIGTSPTTEYKDENVEVGITYTYYVSWVNLLGQESVPSEEVQLELP